MGQAKKQYIEALNGERCWYCNNEMTEEELNKIVIGVPVKKFEDGEVVCADCMDDIAYWN